MSRTWRLALSALLPALVAVGCSDWLTGNKLTNDPNNPTVAARSNLLVGIETGQTVLQTGDLARLFSMWMQQMAGTDRQYVSLGVYTYDEDAFSPDWTAIYAGGGLIDIRALEQSALATGDTIYAGVAYVLEGFTMGTATGIWGDIPYSQAVSDSLKPKLDSQQTVYATVQAKLDTAIAFLACTSKTCVGPGSEDVWYGGGAQQWTALAHTLKARYYLDVSQRIPSAYDSAFAETTLGIADTSGNLNSYQSDIPQEQNIWYQFIVKQRQGYISAGKFLVDLMTASKDPRLAQYFQPITVSNADTIVGAPPNTAGNFSSLNPATRGAPGFRQPMVTFAENQLIRAEAALRKSAPDQAAADAAYNAERTSYGLPTATGVTLPTIINEKYVALFQNGIVVWNDYKRTCLPAITPFQRPIPERLLYPLSAERNANPNVPPPAQQPALNWANPTACT
ncbi:MAG TPA: SusD/RagB family nutrient-binding outer membrane lipoprotein [Gemmatimonadaceae bacterium]